MLRPFSAPGWAAKGPDAQPAGLAIGIALGSGYQAYFAALSTSAQQSEIARMKAAGISWIRMDAEWWTVQPAQGSYDWSVPDVTADAMLAGGMNLVILLNESPSWARKAKNTAPLNSPWPTPDPQLYAQYCAAAASHYSAKGVHVFELWNEPNLDSGDTAAGWGYLSPLGFADLAVVAYPAIKAADPQALVLGGTLSTATEFGTAGTARAASWTAVPAGATSATISCPGAVAGDAYGLLTDTADGWPIGTVITAATAGSGYTVVPPAWLAGFPAIGAGSGTVRASNQQYPPDVFLTQAYARAAGQPMWDALAIHPYTQPLLPTAQEARWGGWATVPTLRQIMKDHGEGAKPMWITEVGAPTGAATASWPAALATDGTLTLSGGSAVAADLAYQLDAGGRLPTGSYVTAVSPGVGWTVAPPVGTLAAALAVNAATGALTLAPTATVLSIPSGTSLTIMSSPAPLTVTTAGDVTTSTSAATTVPITGVTPAHGYATGSVVRGSAGQSWGQPIAATGNQAVTLTPPGVAWAYGQVDEPTQAAIISQVFRSIAVGVPAGNGSLGSDPWPYVGPVFLFTWSDAGGTAGPFGLVRADGTPKAALAALTQLSRTGGV